MNCLSGAGANSVVLLVRIPTETREVIAPTRKVPLAVKMTPSSMLVVHGGDEVTDTMAVIRHWFASDGERSKDRPKTLSMSFCEYYVDFYRDSFEISNVNSS